MNFPHQYVVEATSDASSPVQLSAENLNPISSAPPKAFGGPGDQWSPEDLLVAAVADCFVLSFKAIAGASKFPYTGLTCRVNGTLDRVERVMKFTAFNIEAELTIPADADADRAAKLLEKAEQTCLITNSLEAHPELHTKVVQA